MFFTNLSFKIYAVLFLFFVTPANVLPQAGAVAKILAAQGAVQLARPAGGDSMQQVNLTTGSDLFVGDVIKTKSGGRLVIGLRDGSQAIISENTTVEIKDTNSSPRTIFNVLRGRTRIKIEKMGGKPNPYRITTPTTVIAVRGTVFDVFVKGDKTEVFVTEGEVSVTNFLTRSREVFLLPGQFTRVEKDLPPQEPSTFRQEQNDNFFKNRDDDNSDHGNPNGGDNGKRNNGDGDNGNRNNGDKKDNPGGRDNRKGRGNR